MKTFKQWLKEQGPEPVNSRGVLVHGNKIFVGVAHGTTPQIDSETQALIHQHMAKHGYWHEGNAGDAPVLKSITKGFQYRGSYDEDLINPNLYKDENGKRFTPHYHLANMFGNSSEGTKQTIQRLSSNQNMSIRDAIKKHSSWLFPDAPMKPEHVDKFFSEAGSEYESLGNTKATTENLARFIQKGAADTWSDNETKDTPVGNMAKRVQKTDREGFLLSDRSPPGVYFIGSGHIPSMSKMASEAGKPARLIGGSHASQ